MQEAAPPSYSITQNLRLSAMTVMVNGNFQQSLALEISDFYIFSGLSEDCISASTFLSSVRHEVMDDTIKILFTIPASIAAGSTFVLTLTPKDAREGTQPQRTIPVEDAGIPLQPCSSPGNGEDSGIPDTSDHPFLIVSRGRSTTPAPARTSQPQTPKASITRLNQPQSPSVSSRRQGAIVDVDYNHSAWPVYPLPGRTTIPLQPHLSINLTHGWYVITKGLKLGVFWDYW